MVMMIVQVLFQEILAIVIAVWGADGRVNVLAGGGATPTKGYGALMIELNENNRAVDAVVEDRFFIHLTNPGEAGAVQMLLDFLHLYLGMSFLEVANPKSGELQEGRFLISR